MFIGGLIGDGKPLNSSAGVAPTGPPDGTPPKPLRSEPDQRRGNHARTADGCDVVDGCQRLSREPPVVVLTRTVHSVPSSQEELTSLDDIECCDVPCRVLRESRSTSSLEKHFAPAVGKVVPGTKRTCPSGDSPTPDEGTVRRVDDSVAFECGRASPETGRETEAMLRRCSSLRTRETQRERKIVRFADALGLDLTNVRTFMDDSPKSPRSAGEDLRRDARAFPAPPPKPTLVPRFLQPRAQMNFTERLEKCRVCMENANLLDASALTVSGCVRVWNLSYEKSVHVRFTKDAWVTFADVPASYVPGSSDGLTDRFSFVLYGDALKIGMSLEFAIRFDCSGRQFWDNNDGKNYVFECLPQSPSTSLLEAPLTPTDTWPMFY